MDEIDRSKIKKIIADRENSHEFYQKHSEVYRSFLSLEKTAFDSGKLLKKYKELIAIGISIDKNCESCIEWHIHKAFKAKASIGEIIEAIGIGIEMGGGPATVSSRFAQKVIEFYSESTEKKEIGGSPDLN